MIFALIKAGETPIVIYNWAFSSNELFFEMVNPGHSKKKKKALKKQRRLEKNKLLKNVRLLVDVLVATKVYMPVANLDK